MAFSTFVCTLIQMKEFNPIPNFEGFYECSIVDGTIKSVDRVQEYIGGRGHVYHKRTLRGKIIVPQIQSDGKHYGVTLSKNGKAKSYSVQQLVAWTYPEICGAWFDGAVAHHIDGNPENNSPTNISVITRQAHIQEHIDTVTNNQVRFTKGHTPWNAGKEWIERRGKNHHKTKPVLVYTKNFEVVGTYDTTTEAAKAIGCSQTYVSAVCLGRHDSAKGFYCEYL